MLCAIVGVISFFSMNKFVMAEDLSIFDKQATLIKKALNYKEDLISEENEVDKSDQKNEENYLSEIKDVLNFTKEENKNGQRYTAIHSKNNKEKVIYTTMVGDNVFGVTIGDSVYTMLSKPTHKSPIHRIVRNNFSYTMETAEINKPETYQYPFLYEIDNYYVFYFVDIHDDFKIRASYQIHKNLENKKEGFYGLQTTNYLTSQENLIMALANDTRKKYQLPIYKIEQKYKDLALNHSIDMAKNNYFSHVSKDGRTLLERYKESKLSKLQISTIGENLSAGSFNAFFAHEALMNSLGHREGILNKEYSHVTTGIAINANKEPFITMNFFTPY